MAHKDGQDTELGNVCLNVHQRLFLSGVVSGADLHMATVRALLCLALTEGDPRWEATDAGLAEVGALLDQLQAGVLRLLSAWELSDRRIPGLPALVQAQRLRTGFHALSTLRPQQSVAEEQPLARALASLTVAARSLEEAVLNGHWRAAARDPAEESGVASPLA